MRFIYFALAVLICSSAFAQKWQPFTSKAGAFSVSFPDAPETKDLTRETEEGFSVTAHLYGIFKEPVSAFVIYNEFEPGINIEDDSVYLTTVMEEMISKFASRLSESTASPKVKDILFDGYPGKSLEINMGDVIAHIKVILRSNRAYIVAGVFPKKQKTALDKFVSSFKFIPFQPVAFATFDVGTTVRMELPAKPIFDQETSDEVSDGDQATEAYAVQDPASGDSYSFMISPYSKYAQFEDDSTWVAQYLNAFRSEEESKNEERDLVIDGRPAKELIVKNREHVWTRYLAFVRGNVGYLGLAILHPQHIRNATSERIFSSFKFSGPPTGDLFSDKSSILLKDLVNKDTAVSNAAKRSFHLVTFTDKNLDEVMRYLEQKYPDDGDAENSIKEYLFTALGEIGSEKSISFIDKIFPTLNKNASLEVSAITVLAKLPTREALDARIRLIGKHTPKEKLSYYSILGLYTVDSVDQRYFFDKTNYLLKHAAYKPLLYYFMKELMEQKKLKVQEIANWRALINIDFEKDMVTFRNDSTYASLDDFVIMMRRFETLDKKQVAALTELTKSHNQYIGILAATTLLKQKQSVAPALLIGFAEDHYNRISLFDAFEKESLLQQFPKTYLSQDSLAISQVYTYEEDYIPTKVIISYQGLEDFEGQKMKFYVVRVSFDSDEGETTYRGVIGPFDPNKLSSWGTLNYIDYEGVVDDNDKQFLLDYIAEATSAKEE